MAKIEIIKQIIKEEVEISTCPFCGSSEVEVTQTDGCYGYSYDSAYTRCRCCGSKGPTIKDESYSLSKDKQVLLAVEKWNNRA